MSSAGEKGKSQDVLSYRNEVEALEIEGCNVSSVESDDEEMQELKKDLKQVWGKMKKQKSKEKKEKIRNTIKELKRELKDKKKKLKGTSDINSKNRTRCSC